jgi:hypothetical protein
VVIFKEDVERLTEFLSATNAKFFVFPDFTALYGFLGASSPQPLLWFHKGLTYPREYDERVDKWIVNSLKKNGTDTIILEEYSWFATSARLNDFPLLKKFISANFAKTGRIGIYLIYNKRIRAKSSSYKTRGGEWLKKEVPHGENGGKKGKS